MADSIFEQCLEQIQSDIQGLSDVVVDDSEIVVEWKDWDAVRFNRTITIHPSKEWFTQAGGTCGRDDIGYNCQVTIVVPKAGDHELRLTNVTKWVAAIRSKFINQKLGSITSVYTCHVLTRGVPIPDRAIDRKQKMAKALIIRPWSRESRG